MDNPFSVLLDAPGTPVKRIQIAKLGSDFQHSKYGQFAITQDDVESWRKNLSQLPGGRALIDADHMADRQPRNTSASGWITGVKLEGGVPYADVEWTPKGEQQIRDKEYLFISPTFGPFKDETGAVHDNTLMGAALTNKPFLNMPAISLASDERVSLALDQDPAARFYQQALDGDLGDHAHALVTLDVSQAERDTAHAAGNSLPDKSYPINNAKQLHAAAVLATSGHGDVNAAKTLIKRRAKELGVDVTTLPGFAKTTLDGDTPAASDSRAPEMEKSALIKQLGLDDTADDAKILEAITTLQARPEATEPTEPAAEPKTLEQQAQEAGMVILDADSVKTLQTQATAGAAAMKQLHQSRFDTAFEKAIAERRATPAEQESFQKFYELDADATVDMLEKREAIRPEKPAGLPALELDQNGDAEPEALVAAGLHPGSHGLHQKVVKHMLDNKIPDSGYAKVMEQVASGAVRL